MVQSLNVLNFGYAHKILGLGLHILKVAEALHIVDKRCLVGLE